MHPRRGIHLMELVVVLLVGFLCLGLVAGCNNAARDFAANSDTKANVKNLLVACRIGETEYNKLPPAFGPYGRPVDANKQRTATTFVHMLPYLEQNELFKKGAFDQATVKVFLSALDPSLQANTGTNRYTSFAANLRAFSDQGAQTKFDQPIADVSKCRQVSLSSEKFLDGAFNVVLFTTKYANCSGTANYFDVAPESGKKQGAFFGAGAHVNGGGPIRNIPTGKNTGIPPYQVSPLVSGAGGEACNDDAGLYGHSMGNTGLIVGMADASVRNLSLTVSGNTWAQALCPSDGQRLGDDW